MKLHKKTQIEVQKLLDETGHTLSLEDIDDILTLDELSKRVTGESGEYANIYRWPIRVGSMLLRPLTLSKITWYNQRAKEWFDDDPETQVTLLGFLLSVENDESYLWSLADKESAMNTINEWQRNADATVDELRVAIMSIIDVDDHSGNVEAKSNGDGPLIGLLCRQYGKDPHYWMHEESITVIRCLIDDHTRQINEQAKRHNSSGKKGGKTIPLIKTPSMDATLKFRKKINDMREKWGNHGS